MRVDSSRRISTRKRASRERWTAGEMPTYEDLNTLWPNRFP